LQSALLLSLGGWDWTQQGQSGGENCSPQAARGASGTRLGARRVPQSGWKRLAHDDLAFLAEGLILLKIQLYASKYLTLETAYFQGLTACHYQVCDTRHSGCPTPGVRS